MIQKILIIKAILSSTLLTTIVYSSAQQSITSPQVSPSTSPGMRPTDSPQNCSILSVPTTQETIRSLFRQENLAPLHRSKSTDDLAAKAEERQCIVAYRKNQTPIAGALYYTTPNELWFEATTVHSTSEPELATAFSKIVKQVRSDNPHSPIGMCVTNSTSPLTNSLLRILALQGWKTHYQSIRMTKPVECTKDVFNNMTPRTAFIKITNPHEPTEENQRIINDACIIYTHPALLPYYGCTAEQVARYPRHHTRTTLVAYLASSVNTPIGALTINPRDTKRYHFELAGVRPEHQRSGIATQLYLTAEQLTRSWNPSAIIEVNTFVTNVPVLNAIQKAGFMEEFETVSLRKSTTVTPQPEPMPSLHLPPAASKA